MVDIPYYILMSLVFFLPAFAANPAAVLTGGGTKMDFGLNFRDGRRILGDGKSWRGFILGSLSGSVFGFVIFIPLAYYSIIPGSFPGNLPSAWFISLSLGFGALSGDAIGSFVKRRLNMGRGHNAGLLDQWPFVLTAFLFLYLVNSAFFMKYYGNVIGILTILIVTPPLHRAINIIGYRMRKKEVPW